MKPSPKSQACPWCGETRLVELHQTHRGERVFCNLCGREGPIVPTVQVEDQQQSGESSVGRTEGNFRVGRSHCPCGWSSRLVVIQSDMTLFPCPGCGHDLGLGLTEQDEE